jgi:hypothetical protein
MPIVILGQGDSCTNVAHAAGHIVDKVWNDGQNAALRALRKDPNVLFPGDKLFVPPIETKEIDCAVDQQHTFQLTGEPAKFRTQLFMLDEPRKNEPYTLVVEGKVYQGTTDGDGKLEHDISATAKSAVLMLNGGKEKYPIRIGYLNPVQETSGVQQRLNNLGFHAGSEDGQMNDATRKALAAFQKAAKLPETGQADAATLGKLASLHP